MLPGVDEEHAVKNYIKAAQQGRGEGHVQDGHLHHPELLRRPDLRGHRPRPGRRSTSTSPGRRRASAASASTSSPREATAAPRAAFPDRPAHGRATSTSAASTSGATTASTTCSTRRRSTSCSTPAAPNDYKLFKEYSALDQQPGEAAGHAARADGAEAGGTAGAASRRSSRSRRSSSASRPAPCPTARSARKRTRRWPSP